MHQNTQANFAEKIKELLNMAKKKKNVLEYQEPLSVISIVCNMLYHFFANAHK